MKVQFRSLGLVGFLNFLIVGILSASSVQARLPEPGIGFWWQDRSDTYRIGDEWGKYPVTERDLDRETDVFRRTALSTARVGGATGFYLGKFNGMHVMATNHHVYEQAYQCLGNTVTLPWLNLRLKCNRFFGSWPEVDLALFTVEVNSRADEDLLARVARNFDFRAEIFPGQELLTIGFGSANNSRRQMVAGQDSDCRVFSGRDEFRQMADPDELNPGKYRAWSFANGCDVSHGDSGSAMVDRRTGQVVGIIWTGRIPKDRRVQDSRYLNELLDRPNEDVWTQLSYAVPAAKIGEHLDRLTRDTRLPVETRETLRRILGAR